MSASRVLARKDVSENGVKRSSTAEQYVIVGISYDKQFATSNDVQSARNESAVMSRKLETIASVILLKERG